MKRAIPLILLQLIAVFCLSQQSDSIKRCHTYESMEDFRKKHPEAETDAQFEKWLSIKKKEAITLKTTGTYTIPVIFHIVHNGEAVGTGSNLSAAKIQSQLDQLNADFANLSGSTYGVAANMDIQFCKAVVAPDGTPLAEPGIERIDRNAKGWNAPPYDGFASNSYVDGTIMPNSIWNPYQYFNIWTLDLSGGLLGKATFPTSSGNPGLFAGETDTHAGVFIFYKSVGSISDPGVGGSSYGLGRTLTHEMGHSFGLRHIWGDASCGDDYCTDTPAQSNNSTGCPSPGTASGCVSGELRMYENYMDYTSDNCVNTFTLNQKDRMQLVMTNSPRRKELATAGTCSPEVGNAVRFSSASGSVSETAVVTSCPKYRDISVNINVFTAATDNATLTFSVSGSATNDVDYQLFPSSVSYTNGDNAPKTVTIRVWDDAVVESSENVVVSYSISGTGVVAGSANQTFTLTISDNDQAPLINNSGKISLLNENFGTSGESFPSGWYSGSFRNPAGINRWVVSGNGGGDVTGQSAHITLNTSTKSNSY